MFGIRLDAVKWTTEKLKEYHGRIDEEAERLQVVYRNLQSLTQVEEIRKSIVYTAEYLEDESVKLSQYIGALEQIAEQYERTEQRLIQSSKEELRIKEPLQIGYQDVEWLRNEDLGFELQFE